MLSIRLLCVGALVVVAATATACSQSPTTSGSPAAPSSVTASASSTSSATATSSTTGAPRSTVVVTAPARRTVTRVVQAPQQTPRYLPQTSVSLRALYDDSSSADPSEYYSDSGDSLFFDSPSQNIGCYLSGDDYVSCSIHDYDFPQPGSDCDRGIAATLDSSGYPALTDCSGYFPVANRGTVLQYGESITNGDVACVSESSGVSCLNLDTDTGFSLSRQSYSPVS